MSAAVLERDASVARMIMMVLVMNSRADATESKQNVRETCERLIVLWRHGRSRFGTGHIVEWVSLY